MEKSETQENTTMINNKRNNATTSSSLLPTPNSSPTNPNTEDEEPKPKIQRKCYIIRSPNCNLRITFAKPPSSQQQPSLNNNKQPEASKVELHPPLISNNNNKPKMMKIKKPNNNKSGKLPFVDHDGATKASIIEHVRRNLGYKNEEISEVKIIMEKKMTPTDMAAEQARLAIPASSANNKLEGSFLTNEEEELLKNKGTNITVKVIAGSSVYEMPLSRWSYYQDKEKKNNDNNNNNKDLGFKYVLKNGLRHQWSKLKEENGLQEDDYVLVATFRYNNALHFVIVKAKPVMLFGTAIGVHTLSRINFN